MDHLLKNIIFLSGIFAIFILFTGCTNKSLEVGDCVLDPQSRRAEEMIRITQKVDGGYFGTRYLSGENMGEVVELDAAVNYQVTECPK